MVDVPSDTPVNIPELEPTVATPGLVENHVPPGTVLCNVDVPPRQTFAEPVIGVGAMFTVTACVTEQPRPSVYAMLATPGNTPVTSPKASTVPIVGVRLL